MKFPALIEWLERRHRLMREEQRMARAAQFAHDHPEAARRAADAMLRPSHLPD